ncbi:tetraspanin [Holotrichia oblita]|uniref:Tetraspanin n=1 Tax=Holotrichia oblita TaxID=644536 RepID=A0ACB9T2S0_HOLOL|nr:tetraspanin [Holotrichia oblita]
MGSDLDVGMKCVKYMLFITNFMFVIIGFLLISIGTAITYIYNDFDLFIEDHYFSPAALLVAIGIITFFVSLFGCAGAIKGSTCMVNIYGIFLILLLILEVSAAIAAYAMRSSIEHYIKLSMTSTLDKYLDHSHIRDAWDALQCRLACCGINGYWDWIEVDSSRFNETISPESCFNAYEERFEAGCWQQLVYTVSQSALLVGTAAICVAVVQALGVVFAFMLAKSIRRIKSEQERKRQQNRARIYEQLARGNDEKPTPVIYTASKA